MVAPMRGSKAAIAGALALASAAALGCGTAPPAHDDGCADIREPDEFGTTSAALSLSSLANGNGCSTAGAERLSNQILDELLCLLDGRLVPVSHPNLVPSHPRVHLVLSPAARSALLSVAQTQRLTINSALRTISEQYLLWRGCPVAADPGTSNHETGKAIDVDEYGAAAGRLQNAGFVYPLPSSDPVHFEGPGADLRAQSVLAFQRLWNDNRPSDRIDEDGVAGPMTLARLAQAPTAGFAVGGRCVRGAGDAGTPVDAGSARDAGPGRDAGSARDAAPTDDAGETDASDPTDDAGAVDASPSTDATGTPPPSSAPSDDGGGCSVHGPRAAEPRASAPIAVLVAMVLAARRRRGRREGARL
jgi:N-acetylmuramoyl-L-alanine amidase